MKKGACGKKKSANSVSIFFQILQKWLGPKEKGACMKKCVWIAFLSYYILCKNG